MNTNKIFLIAFVFLLVFPFVNSIENNKIKVNFEIIPYGIPQNELNLLNFDKTSYIVGDSFYYKLRLESENITNENLEVLVFSPSKEIIGRNIFNLNNKTIDFIPKYNKYNLSYSAFPFSEEGVYELRLCSKEDSFFYKEVWFHMENNYAHAPTPIGYEDCFSYYFDAITLSKYKENLQEKDSISTSKNLNTKIINLTWAIFILTLVLVFFGIIQISSEEKMKKNAIIGLNIILAITLIAMGIFLFNIIKFIQGLSFWLSIMFTFLWYAAIIYLMVKTFGKK
ncbi:MAG: hypothetical protein P8X70_01125 [Nanoarchaeota archaeon]